MRKAQLPDELEQAIASLNALDDAALWPVARSHMAPDAADRLQELNHKQQLEGLTEAERHESELLVGEYERAMLLRAQAAALLKERGHDISSLLVAHPPDD